MRATSPRDQLATLAARLADPRWVTSGEAATLLGVSSTRVRQLLTGEAPQRPQALPPLRGERLAGMWLVELASVNERRGAREDRAE